MFVKANVRPNNRKNAVTEEKGELTICVTAPAKEGRANEAAAKLLAGYYGVSKSSVFVAKGAKSKTKIFKILI